MKNKRVRGLPFFLKRKKIKRTKKKVVFMWSQSFHQLLLWLFPNVSTCCEANSFSNQLSFCGFSLYLLNS